MPRRASKKLAKPPKKAGFVSLDEEGNELWEIEHVIEKRVRKGVNEYLVKWKGWSKEHCTWEPESSFLEDMDKLREYIQLYQNSQKKGNKPNKPLIDEEGNAIWEIEHIIDKRVTNGVKEYLVKWKGWSQEHCTWEPESSFFEDADQLQEYFDKYHESQKNGNKRIQKKAKPNGVRKTKKSMQLGDDDNEASEDTKIIIQRIILPNTTNPAQQEDEDDDYRATSQRNNNSFITPEKPTEFFICKNTDDDNTTQVMTDENTTNPSSNSKSVRFLWTPAMKTANPLQDDSEDDICGEDSEDYSPRRREELETDKLAEMMSCPSQIKEMSRNGLPPLMLNELENTEEFKIKIIECFTFLKGNAAAPESLRFKVAFFDDEGNLKGYDYFSYEEIRQKNWDSQLLEFFTQEIVEEIARTGRSLTRNIKLI